MKNTDIREARQELKNNNDNKNAENNRLDGFSGWTRPWAT